MRLTLMGIMIGAILCGSAWRFARKRTAWRFQQLLGAGCLGMVVLTHISENFHFFPEMGWGRPNSAGHYLDLTCAILGLFLLLSGYIFEASFDRKNSK